MSFYYRQAKHDRYPALLWEKHFFWSENQTETQHQASKLGAEKSRTKATLCPPARVWRIFVLLHPCWRLWYSPFSMMSRFGLFVSHHMFLFPQNLSFIDYHDNLLHLHDKKFGSPKNLGEELAIKRAKFNLQSCKRSQKIGVLRLSKLNLPLKIPLGPWFAAPKTETFWKAFNIWSATYFCFQRGLIWPSFLKMKKKIVTFFYKEFALSNWIWNLQKRIFFRKKINSDFSSMHFKIARSQSSLWVIYFCK